VCVCAGHNRIVTAVITEPRKPLSLIEPILMQCRSNFNHVCSQLRVETETPESIEKPDKRQIKFLKDIDVRRINEKHVGDETQTFPKQIVRPFFVLSPYIVENELETAENCLFPN